MSEHIHVSAVDLQVTRRHLNGDSLVTTISRSVWALVFLVGALVLLGAACGPRAANETAPGPPGGAATSASVASSQASVSGPLPTVPFERGDARRGEDLFGRAGCVGCHTARGFGGAIGPDLTEVALRAPGRAQAAGVGRPELYFVQSIVYPQAYVVDGFPPVMLDWKQLALDEQNLADLAAFLSTLTGP